MLWQWTAATFLLNVWVASIALFRDKHPYSLNRMFWIFVLVFFAVVPGLQVATQRLPWGNDVAPAVFLRANLLVLAGCAVYQLTRYIAAAVASPKPPLFPARLTDGWVKSYTFIGTAIFALLAVGYFYITLPDAVFLQKDLLNKWRDRVPDNVYLFLEKDIRSPVLYFCLFSVFLYRLRRISKGWMTAILAVGLLVNFPLVMTRTLAAAVCAGILLSFGGTYWQRHRQAFTLGILAVLFLLFPLSQVARRTSDRLGPPITQPVQLYARSFAQGDFDAYAMLCRALHFTDTAGYQKGRQLQTSLAFAVPRKVWPGKSVGSGALMRQKAGEYFHNVSCPLLAEGFIDFGWMGALLYFALFALLARHYDSHYWYWRLHRAAAGDVSFAGIFYPAMLALLFHLLRGDLLSGFAQLFGMLLFAWATHHVVRLGGKFWKK